MGYVFWRTYYFLRESLFWFISLFTKKGEPGDEGAVNWVQHESQEQHVLHEGEIFLEDLIVTTSNVTYKNCIIHGSVRIKGPARNGESSSLYEKSRTGDYVRWIRTSSPTNVVFENCTIEGDGSSIPLYVAPGVTKTKLKNSRIIGESPSVMIYLDAESHGTVIEHCTVDGTHSGREVIAIDASDFNVIRNNKIIFKREAGILLYRNCGLKGVIRHTTPSNNNISWNEFIRKGFSDIAIHVGSRRGGRIYCCQDRGFLFGSSQSDLDHARNNDIKNNVINKCRILGDI